LNAGVIKGRAASLIVVSKRLVYFSLFAVVVILVSFLIQSNETEAERVQRETEFASKACKLVAKNQVWHSPRLLTELALRKGNNPFYAQYWEGLYRLKKIGVLQERSFQFLDTNGAPVKINVNKLFPADDVLWMIQNQSNGVYIVSARPEAMKPWEELQRQYLSNSAAQANQLSPVTSR
jgi:hypothetical protein